MDAPDMPVHHAHIMVNRRRPRRPAYRRTYIREWREHRGLTLEQLADRIESTHATLSRIERGVVPYSQPMLEAIAEALATEPASLLIRNPTDPEGIWSIWDTAKPGERERIVAIARALRSTGS